MAYGICRIQKLKAGAVGRSAKHTSRKQETPNADPTRQHIRIIGEPDSPDAPDLETLVRQHIGNQTIRKNAVLAVEFLLTASPEYFRPDHPGLAGYYEQKRLEDFQHHACAWLLNRYGERIVRAELHLDESTPHIHAYLVPLDEKGKLNCRALLGGSRYRLSELQDDFATAMAPLGLERGIKGSRAKHTEISKYYAAIHSSPDATLDISAMQQLVADRQRAINDSAQMEQTSKSLARELERSKLRVLELERLAQAAEQNARVWKNKYQELADKVRDIPLEQVTYELGLDPDPKDKHKWQHENHIINITGSKFYDWQHLKGGGGAIDLVMHVNACNFKVAVAWLNDRFGERATLEAVSYQTRAIIQTEPVPQFTPPVPDESKWQVVKTYLTRERRLPSSLVDNLHDSGLIYADDKQNVVFIRRALDKETITGATLRGTAGVENTFKGLALGSKRSAGWFHFKRGGQSEDPIQRAVLVESPIDAMSFAVLDRTDSRKTIYLSTDGAGQIPVQFLRTLPNKSVIVAYDNDQPGNLMALRVMEQLPNAVRKNPKAKDWNEELKNMFNLEPQQQQQRESERKTSRGFSL
ncbi:plasmid recombination protein (plasmid) [Gloeocapsa sp. PCC 7428]|uniref:MobV family relaxase n=1 Tax=Gloeocapsa sp. PCC 7428 TaxID=1173026 RepID=UPI0002A5C1EE|nr:MobV family relaxase [Gloeocapsa sp. PCC 7428]AFZ33600.1 plasmid recombination protein [Gloeocapsa sp. PCC 7428]